MKIFNTFSVSRDKKDLDIIKSLGLEPYRPELVKPKPRYIDKYVDFVFEYSKFEPIKENKLTGTYTSKYLLDGEKITLSALVETLMVARSTFIEKARKYDEFKYNGFHVKAIRQIVE